MASPGDFRYNPLVLQWEVYLAADPVERRPAGWVPVGDVTSAALEPFVDFRNQGGKREFLLADSEEWVPFAEYEDRYDWALVGARKPDWWPENIPAPIKTVSVRNETGQLVTETQFDELAYDRRLRSDGPEDQDDPSIFTDPASGARFLVGANGALHALPSNGEQQQGELVTIGGQQFIRQPSGSLQPYYPQEMQDPIAAQLEAQAAVVQAQQATQRAQQARSVDELITRELDSGNYAKAQSLWRFKNQPSVADQLDLALKYADKPEALKVLFDFITGLGMPVSPEAQQSLKHTQEMGQTSALALQSLYDPAGAAQELQRRSAEAFTDTPPASGPFQPVDGTDPTPAKTGPFAVSPEESRARATMTPEQEGRVQEGVFQEDGSVFRVTPQQTLGTGVAPSAEEALAGNIVPLVIDGTYTPTRREDVEGVLASANSSGQIVSVPDQQSGKLFALTGVEGAFRFSPEGAAFKVGGRDYPTPGRTEPTNATPTDVPVFTIQQNTLDNLTSPTTALPAGTTKLVNPATGQVQIIASEDVGLFKNNIGAAGDAFQIADVNTNPVVKPQERVTFDQFRSAAQSLTQNQQAQQRRRRRPFGQPFQVA